MIDRSNSRAAMILRVVTMTALINDEVKPLFIAKALPGPMHPHGVRGHGCLFPPAKCRAADPLPAFTSRALIVVVSSNDPDDVVCPIT